MRNSDFQNQKTVRKLKNGIREPLFRFQNFRIENRTRNGTQDTRNEKRETRKWKQEMGNKKRETGNEKREARTRNLKSRI